MRDHYENAHIVIASSFLTALFGGWTIQDWAACGALISSIMVVGSRLYRLYRWVKAWRSKE
jgi:hypothetical protein